MKTKLGEVSEKAPVSFDSKGNTIATSFVIHKDGSLGFAANFPKKSGYTIDPQVIWSSYYGGSQYDMASSCTTDASGNLYVSGSTESSFLGIAGYDDSYNSGMDAFLVKLDAAGVPQWATYYGGSGVDVGAASDIDSQGNVYLTGHTSSVSGIAYEGYQDTKASSGTGTDAFVVKFSSAGARIWGTYFGGPGSDSATNIKVNSSDELYIVGETASTADITSSGYQSTYGGGSADAYLVKFNAQGGYIWGTYFGGIGLEDYPDMDLDSNGNIYLSGTTTSAGLVSLGFDTTLTSGTSDAFLVKFSPSGNHLWSTYYGGNGYDSGFTCVVDPSDNIYLGGKAGASSLNLAFNGFQSASNGGADAFLVKFDSSGLRLWSTYYGGQFDEHAFDSTVDTNGNVYIIGDTQSPTGIAANGFDNTLSLSGDINIVKFDPSGFRIWGSYYGDGGDEYPGGCATDSNGNLYIVGRTNLNDGFISGGYDTEYAALNDMLLVKIDGSGGCDTPAPQAQAEQFLCTGTTLAALDIEGTGLKFYTTLYGGTPLLTTTFPPAGIYYVSQTIDDCEGPRTAIAVTPTTTPAPTSSAQTLCGGSKIEDLVATGSNHNWYTDPIAGSALDSEALLASGIYYVSQTMNGCESTRTAVNVIVNTTPIPTALSQSFCGSATVANLTATGTDLKWYTVLTGGAALASNAVLSSGTYYLSQTLSTCESLRVAVAVIVTTAPIAPAIQNFCSSANIADLNATGTSLTWYTTATGGPALTSGTLLTNSTYYVSQTFGECESPRAAVAVIISQPITPAFTTVAPICSGSNLTALPLTSSNGITGTWAPALNNTATATYTFTPAQGQCATTTTMTITVDQLLTPVFTAVAPICSGSTIAALPLTSNNGITGSWSPALNNAATTTYTFTPDQGQCAATTTMTIPVDQPLTPVFTVVAPICSGSTIAALPLTSNNGISGTWAPALNNTATTTYTFTPAQGQCATTTTMTITVDQPLTPVFTVVAPICSGSTVAALPLTSNNGISGTWAPALNNTATTTYTFTPAPGQCATATTMTITIVQSIIPQFTSVAPICSGSILTALPVTSNNGITGIWSPALNNTATTTYTFMPAPGQCATTTTMTITVDQPLNPLFNAVAPVCYGTTITPLPLTSNNGVNGTWSPALNSAATTTYTFTPDPGQCAANTTLTIGVHLPITPIFTSIAPICSGSEITTLPSISNNGIAGAWSPALNNTATTTYTFTPAQGECATISTMTIVVYTTDATITVGGATIIVSQSGASYQWVDCENSNAFIPGADDQSFTATENGQYAVIIDYNGCSTLSECVTISSLTVNEIETQSGLKLYPIPTAFLLSISTDETIKAIEITDMFGKKIKINNFAGNRIDVSFLQEGVYFAEIKTDNTTYFKKFVKHNL